MDQRICKRRDSIAVLRRRQGVAPWNLLPALAWPWELLQSVHQPLLALDVSAQAHAILSLALLQRTRAGAWHGRADQRGTHYE
jgi:hypothetical protein